MVGETDATTIIQAGPEGAQCKEGPEELWCNGGALVVRVGQHKVHQQGPARLRVPGISRLQVKSDGTGQQV